MKTAPPSPPQSERFSKHTVLTVQRGYLLKPGVNNMKTDPFPLALTFPHPNLYNIIKHNHNNQM